MEDVYISFLKSVKKKQLKQEENYRMGIYIRVDGKIK